MRKIIILMLFLIMAFVTISCSSKQIAENSQAQAVLQEQPSKVASEPQDPFVQENYCPRGVTDDPYPGDCWQYTDQDQDSLCDLGND